MYITCEHRCKIQQMLVFCVARLLSVFHMCICIHMSCMRVGVGIALQGLITQDEKKIGPGWKRKSGPAGREDQARPKQKIRPNMFNILNNPFYICSNAFSNPLTYILK